MAVLVSLVLFTPAKVFLQIAVYMVNPIMPLGAP